MFLFFLLLLGFLLFLLLFFALLLLVLLLLLLPRRKFRAFTVGVLVFVAVSLLSMLWLGPDLATAWKGSLQNVFGYQQVRAVELSARELNANHSWFLLVKFAAAVPYALTARNACV